MQRDLEIVGLRVSIRGVACLFGAVAVLFMSATTPIRAEEASTSTFNYCSPCQDLDDLECGVVLLNAISHCCGQGNGNASCNTGLSPDAYAVACSGGGGCVCGDWGDNCTPREGEEPLSAPNIQ
jgi:hypothetical protein